MRYYPSLDGLRFFAVLLVIIHHWLPGQVINLLPNGKIGVTIFFVLSGFLISCILMLYRNQVELKKISLKHALRIFYIRRSIRIFPVYYLFIIFLFFYGYSAITKNPIYFLTYTSNILFYLNDSMAGTVSHLWTLAVEEQFYLFWPFVILLIPKKFLKATILSFITLSIIIQLTYGLKNDYINLLTFTTFDSFGIGALLAYFKIYEHKYERAFMKWMGIFFSLSVLLILTHLGGLIPDLMSARISTSLFTGFLLTLLTFEGKGEMDRLNAFLSQPGFVYIGKISYGIYLFHTLIPGLMNNLYSPLNIHPNQGIWLYITFFINFAVTVGIASASWYLFESPINRQKRHFIVSA